MLNQIIRRTALSLLVRGEIGLYWDLVYIYKYGLPKIEWPFPSPFEEPTPTPTIEWQRETDALLFDLVNIVAGDPSPQPSLQALLNDRGPRLDAAKRAYQQHEEALGALEQEIELLQG
jgi:hypothetical protein